MRPAPVAVHTLLGHLGLWRWCAVLLAVAFVLQPPVAHARVVDTEGFNLGWLDARRPLTDTTWLSHYLLENQRLGMDGDAGGTLVLDHYQRPWVAGLSESGWFARGRYGPRAWSLASLNWNDSACGQESGPGVLVRGWTVDALPTLTPPGPIRLADAWLSMSLAPQPVALEVKPLMTCPSYQTPPKVTIVRTDGEFERLRLLECDGSLSADTLDRFSVLLRPLGVPKPVLPLPVEPESNREGEWIDGVKLMHPRLVWAVQRIARAFPWRSITVLSGYRRESHGYHPKGRAVDLSVHGVDNRELFQFCRSLHDVGCGYYPNNKFVHVDVRAFGSAHPSWIDAAEPGHPSRYVDHWPGLDAAPSSTNPDH